MNKKLVAIIAAAILFLAAAIIFVLALPFSTEAPVVSNTETAAVVSNNDNYKEWIPEDFTVYDLEGNEVELSDMKGKPLVINVWSSWCYACTKELPDFESVWKEYGDSVTFMMINRTDGTKETMRSLTVFLQDKGYEFPVYCDTTGEAYRNLRVYGVPMTFFIDADGYIRYHVSSEITQEELIDAIEKICE